MKRLVMEKTPNKIYTAVGGLSLWHHWWSTVVQFYSNLKFSEKSNCKTVYLKTIETGISCYNRINWKLHVLPCGNCIDLLRWRPSFLFDGKFSYGGSSSLIESNDSKEVFSVADWNSIWILLRSFDILDKISVIAIS